MYLVMRRSYKILIFSREKCYFMVTMSPSQLSGCSPIARKKARSTLLLKTSHCPISLEPFHPAPTRITTATPPFSLSQHLLCMKRSTATTWTKINQNYNLNMNTLVHLSTQKNIKYQQLMYQPLMVKTSLLPSQHLRRGCLPSSY